MVLYREFTFNCDASKKFIAYTASWCGPCEMAKPWLEHTVACGILTPCEEKTQEISIGILRDLGYKIPRFEVVTSAEPEMVLNSLTAPQHKETFDALIDDVLFADGFPPPIPLKRQEHYEPEQHPPPASS